MERVVGVPETIFELSQPEARAFTLPALGVPECSLDEVVPACHRRRCPANLPEIAEIDLVRHFTRLARLNFGVDDGSYPLGSCTMKYNPKVNERVAALEGLRGLHPYQPEHLVQGALRLLCELGEYLEEIAGLHATTFQPAAGAHGELTGLFIARAYHEHAGRSPKKVIIPDTAHGTNPASVSIAGYEVVGVKSDARGGIDIADLRSKTVPGEVACLMLTNPNTLGLFDENIVEIARVVHEAGGLLYYEIGRASCRERV
jgi:Glycine cleavage system protein P (pyridoxal-binding), C-terminal domain